MLQQESHYIQLIEAIIFVPRAHFLRGGLALLHSNNSHQIGQSISTTGPANRNASVVEEHAIGEETVVSLTKVKEKLKVDSKFIIYSTEKPSEFCNI